MSDRVRLIGIFLGIAACVCPMAAHAHGSHDERVAELAADLAQRPDDPQLHFLLVQANIEHGDWEVSLQSLETVEKLAPGKFPTGRARAEALLLGGRRKTRDRLRLQVVRSWRYGPQRHAAAGGRGSVLGVGH